jgi:exosortase/archaeosortase family protein
MDDSVAGFESNTARPLVPKNLAWLGAVTLCQLVAYWGAWAWLYRRVSHSAADVFGMFAVVGMITYLAIWTIAGNRRVFRFSLLPIVLLMLIYGTSYLVPTPSILRAAIASISLFLTVHFAIFGRQPPVAYWGMILFALPIVPSLQFYLGFPARLLSASLTVPLLRMNGLSVHREGTYLVWQDKMIQFDAPCSGVTMLWAGILLTFSLAYLQKFTALRTALALVVCGLFILVGNVLRAGSLFYLETGLFPAPATWWHDAVGIVVFVATAIALLATLNRLNSSYRA